MVEKHYKYSDKEINEILKSITIIVDTREKKNLHILSYFEKKKIPCIRETMHTGDYTAMVPKNEELGIMRDTYIDSIIERKNGIDELVGSIKDRTRFENELIRASKYPFVLLVEDLDGYMSILKGDYISKYDSKALLGSLKTFEVRYGFSTLFVDKSTTGNYIYHHFLYTIRELLKDGSI